MAAPAREARGDAPMTAASPDAARGSSWTILPLVEACAGTFREHGLEEPRLNAELLLGRVLGLRRIQLYTNFDRPVGVAELQAFRSLARRRMEREPLQYILGETEFMGLVFEVSPAVLIPRPETEVLTERALELLRAGGSAEPSVLDLGTGAGNIAVSIAHAFPGARVTGMDASRAALALAERNRIRHGASGVRLVEGDVFGDSCAALPLQDLILSNPPYLSPQEFSAAQPEVRLYEPRMALCDEEDGLRFIRRIAHLASTVLRSGGTLLVEVGYDQSAEAVRIFRGAGLEGVRTWKDAAGIERVVEGAGR